jgi:hypothetical protein
VTPRRPLLTLIAAATLGATAAATTTGASAAEPWSAPVSLQAGLRDATPTAAAATTRGALVAGWNADSAASGPSGWLALRPVGAAAAHPIALGTQLSAGPVAYAFDRAAVMPVRFGRIVGGYVRQTLYLRTLDTTGGGTLSRSTRLVHDAQVMGSALAGSAPGDVAAAWIVRTGGRDVVSYAVRRRGGRLGPAHVVSGSGHAEAVALAYDGRGDLLVAYARYRDGRRRVFARVQAVGHGIGHETDLGPQTGQLRIAAAGQPNAARFVVAWQTEDPSGAGPGFPPRVLATTRSTLGRFAPAQTLDAGTVAEYAAGAIQASYASDGVATVAWSQPTASGQRPRAATGAAGQPFAVGDLAGDGVVTGLASARDATTTVLTSPAPGSAGPGVLAFTRPAGARTLSAAQDVDADPTATGALAAAPDGHVDALWVAGPSASRSVRLAER